jgi:tetratricopeptide (TPR) repeat protein
MVYWRLREPAVREQGIDRGRRLTSWRAITLVVITVGVSLEAQSLPTADGVPMPPPSFAGAPPGTRTAFEGAYRDASGHPTDASRAGRLAMLLHAHEQLASASLWYRKAQRLEPDGFAWPYLAAVAEAETGDQRAAVGSFRAALAIDPTHVAARMRLAEALWRAGDLDASIDEYTTVLRDVPELAAAHYGLGRVWSIRGDPATAAAHYRRAIDLVPEFGVAHYALGLAYRDLADPDRARQHLDAYARLGPRQPTLPDALIDRVAQLKSTARDLLAAAAQLGAQGRIHESIARHLEAIEADPATAAQAHVNLISLYGRSGEPDRAEAHYRAALSLGTSLADAHYNYGVLLASLGRAAEAAEVFQRALDVNPFHAHAHNNLATLLAGQHRLDAAASHYAQAIATDPGHRGARFNLGRTLVALGRPREAIRQFERLLTSDDADTPRVALALATAWFAVDDARQALAYAEQAHHGAIARGQVELAATIEAMLRKIRARQ